MPARPPRVTGYQIRGLIEQANIGGVWRAYDPRNGREVALKGLWGKSPLSHNERHGYFRHEADMLARFAHPRIPKLLDFVDGKRPYIALELVDGPDLEQMLQARNDPLPVAQVVGWGIQVCAILDYLHGLQPEAIAFCDLKPSHIVIDPHGDAWLIDFNLAVVLPPEKVERNAPLQGTEGFAAPEQYKGIVSPRSDIYALGASLHYLLTRRDPRKEQPFSFDQLPPRKVNPDVTPELETAIMRAVRFEARERFASAEAFKAALAVARKSMEG